MTSPNDAYGDHGGPVQLFFLKKSAPRRPMVERGEGIYLWDTQGRRYIDASSGPIASNLGHGNARVIEAADRQMRKVAYASRVFFENDANIALADIVTGLAGPGLERAFFVSGGSEANESAMKMARQYAITQGQASRWKVLSRNPSYHGSTLGTIAISGDPVSEASFGPMTRLMPKVPAPFTYRLPEGHTRANLCRALRRRARRNDRCAKGRRRCWPSSWNRWVAWRPARWWRRIATTRGCARSAAAMACCWSSTK